MIPIKQRLITVVMMILITAGLFANGSGGADTSADTDTSEPITVWVGGQVAELDDTWQTVVNRYIEETGRRVEVQLFGFDTYYDNLLTALQGGRGPDLAFADLGGWVPTFASQGWLTPMEDMISAWPDEDQIWPNLWPTVTFENTRYGLPWYTDARLLLYNKQMFRDAGLDPESPPETWDELVEQAKIITESGERIFGYGVSGTKTEHTTLAYIVFLASNGGKLLSDDYTRAAFNTPEGLRALEFYTDLAVVHGVSPEAVSYNEDDYRNLMAQGAVAMAVGGPWSFPLIEQANPDIDYSLSIHPYGSSPASVFGGWSLVIPSSSKRADAAWDFARYLTSYDTWMFWIGEKGGPMPVRMDVSADSPVLRDEKWRNILEVFPNAVYRAPIPEYPQVSEAIQLMIQAVLLGDKTPAEAIAEAETEVNAVLAR